MEDVFRDCRSEGGHDGIYPIHITDSDGTMVANPMELKREHGGLSTHYLDLQVTIGSQRSFRSTVFQKRDDMPVFHDYLRFPRIDSLISEKAKYGVFTSQLHRFATLCNTSHAFTYNVMRLLKEMLTHGYTFRKLRSRLIQFRLNYKLIQRRVFARRLLTKTVRGIWRTLLFQCNRLHRNMLKDSM